MSGRSLAARDLTATLEPDKPEPVPKRLTDALL
jgi:hypothetical protein